MDILEFLRFNTGQEKADIDEWKLGNCFDLIQAYAEHYHSEQCNIPDVVHSKTPQKIAVVGCGDTGITVARRLAEKGFEAVAVHGIENSPLTLQDIRPPVDIEPLILENTLPDNPFYKPQNRADRRKKARNKGKKKNR